MLAHHTTSKQVICCLSTYVRMYVHTYTCTCTGKGRPLHWLLQNHTHMHSGWSPTWGGAVLLLDGAVSPVAMEQALLATVTLWQEKVLRFLQKHNRLWHIRMYVCMYVHQGSWKWICTWLGKPHLKTTCVYACHKLTESKAIDHPIA